METLILQTEQGTCANKIHITAEAACQLSKLNRSHKKYSDDQPSWSLYIPILHHSTGIAIQIFPDPNPLDVDYNTCLITVYKPTWKSAMLQELWAGLPVSGEFDQNWTGGLNILADWCI